MTREVQNNTRSGPLAGLQVIEIGHFVAAPFATRVLADLGADVIKVEQPGSGDPARSWGAMVDGRSLWWSVHARNKRSITLNLKHSGAREVLLDLVRHADAVLENFRPGQLGAWGVGFDAMQEANPSCVLVSISGYGQTGPYRDRVSFGVIGEAIGGLRHLTGYPPEIGDLPPVRTGISLGDSIAGLYAVIGLLAAVWRRDVKSHNHRQQVDVALHEAVFSLLEGSLPEYGRLGIVRQPSGSRIPTAAPTNAYRCGDGRWLLIAGNSDRIFIRLMNLIGRPDLAQDPGLQTNNGRLERVDELDCAISAWTATLDSQAAGELLDENDVPASRIYTIADCAEDPHYHARGMVQTVNDPEFGPLLHPGVVPKFSEEEMPVRWPGPALGAHNEEIYRGVLGYSADRLERLKREGVI
ncbi:CaiB/BaiF CoA transferase family protein [Microvirga massiliensis]|uniref:CaiB/BaiF CoA transferase family protein n=1 Tax=Microvirga massiliensis TaxID=1033741 RepID=UPI00062BA0D0|nr:CaiB/BaiF CoA-transferase family protein [Microvirga massiliensis]